MSRPHKGVHKFHLYGVENEYMTHFNKTSLSTEKYFVRVLDIENA